MLLGILLVAGAILVTKALPVFAYPEVKSLSHFKGSFHTLQDYFTKLAQAKGAPYAYEILRRAALPPDTDLHLLGHVVGDVLYKQQGVDGIKICTQEFRNACSHAIVVGAFYDNGEAALPLIAQACQQAPGGPGAYGMCFHGLGHGVLASVSYDEKKAIALCKKVGTPERFNEEYKQCVSGTIMELTGGGDHDKALWAVERMKYLSATDPLAPCDRSYMPEEVKPMCYVYLTPHFFEMNGGSLFHPGGREFTQAFSYCSSIPAQEIQNRSSCFGGIGKELPTLAMARDIRVIDQIPPEKLALVYSWCALGKTNEATGGCVRQVVESLFWGGENDPKGAALFCAGIPAGAIHDVCTGELFQAATYFLIPADKKRDRICGTLQGDDRRSCSAALFSMR